MIKKILAAFSLVSASISALAAGNNDVSVNKPVYTIDKHVSHVVWSFGPHSSFPSDDIWGMLWTSLSNKGNTVILYVRKNRRYNHELISDPVLIDCNGISTIVNPGSSKVCNITVQDGADLMIIEAHRKNGSDVYATVLDDEDFLPMVLDIK